MPKNSAPGRIALRRVARGVAPGRVTEKPPDAFDRLANRLQAVGIGEPDIVFPKRAKAGAGDCRHALLVEQPALKTARIVPGTGDVRKDVERAARIGTAY